jgi:hypothetical protein
MEGVSLLSDRRRSFRIEETYSRAGRALRWHRHLPIPQWLIAAVLALLATPSLAIEGMWHGKYVCAQGLTGLALTITKTANGSDWIARFCFCAIEENPNLPTGECELTSPVVPNETIVKFTPLRWIMRPPGWEMRPLELWQSADGQHIFGQIDALDCRPQFQLDRLTSDSAQPKCQCRVVTSQLKSDVRDIGP